MATLTVSVSGPPHSGKTDVLTLIQHILEANGISAICKTEQLESNPKMDGSAASVIKAIDSLNDRKPLVVLEEVYITADGTPTTNHDEQANLEETVTAKQRVNPLH